ncbi:hypothetical protein GEV33_003830 [Tenebrio molitor]|uniref:Uncharacterized protein n=1 Tax=Tenebrio molitor TaxID=7067 RepID=A0A8J6LNA8_TENMO|nr:hypothetical protein GEV33_003830 [Tenebrio molitor]
MLSLWRRRGRQDGVALEYVLSTEKPPSYGSRSDDDATWWRFVARVELPPIAYCRPVRVHVCFNLRYRLHPKGEKIERFVPQGNLLAVRPLKSICDERGGSYLTPQPLKSEFRVTRGPERHKWGRPETVVPFPPVVPSVQTTSSSRMDVDDASWSVVVLKDLRCPDGRAPRTSKIAGKRRTDP